MVFIYYLFVKFYGIVIFLASPLNKKAGLWVRGRFNWYNKLKTALQHAGEKRIHFHCPSLGEYEQGKPVLEALRKKYPDYFIVLTFYSPSGYEHKKNDPLADHVCYLPLDGPVNAARFVKLLQPKLVFFVKYDFWHFFIRQYHSLQIPVIYISSAFRPGQIFFKWYGAFFRNTLKKVNHFFVQDQKSLEILYENSIPDVTVSGDTRFDRVYENHKNHIEIPEIVKFKESKKIFVAGSTWPSDTPLLKSLIESTGNAWKFVIVPHEVSKLHIDKLSNELPGNPIRFSNWDEEKISSNVLIVDSIGLLSSIYHYTEIAYVGGGFGKGIHNILEAVVFGIPVIIGPNHKKFREALELKKLGGVIAVNNKQQLNNAFNKLDSDPESTNKIHKINNDYINKNRGATKIVMEYLALNFETL
jgi:3-deoxy-D-manno-octulosonic-acid transferase